MKSRIVAALIVACATASMATAQDAGATGIGVQVASSGSVEAGIAAETMLYDASREGFVAEFSTGFSIGDVEWDEYLDLGPRLSLDQMIGVRSYVSALIYPFWFSTRDVSGVEDDWSLTATIPTGRLAVTFLF